MLDEEIRSAFKDRTAGATEPGPDPRLVYRRALAESRSHRARRGRVLAAAAVVLVIGAMVGLIAVASDDTGPERVTTQPGATAEEIEEPPFTTELRDVTGERAGGTTSTSVGLADPWEFGITVIEVEAGNAVAASEDSAWVAASDRAVLSKIDLDTNAVVSVTEIPAGGRTATFGFGSVWVGHEGGTVSRFDAESGELITTIEVGGDTTTWIEPSADSIWLGNWTGGQAVRIDPGTNAVVARIDVGEATGAIMENRHGVWIRGFDGAVTRIDPSTNEIVARIETADGAFTLGATADAVWAPGGSAGVVYRVDPSTNRVSGQVDVSGSVGSPASVSGIHAVGGSVWVRFSHDCVDAECTQSVGRIDPESNEVVAVADLPPNWGSSGMSVGPDTAWTFSSEAIARIDF